jgi:hypothetical protein
MSGWYYEPEQAFPLRAAQLQDGLNEHYEHKGNIKIDDSFLYTSRS